MEWKEYSREEAKYRFDELQEGVKEEIPQEYSELKLQLSQAFREALKLVGNDIKNNRYKFDCYFAIMIYKIFNQGKYAIKERDASNDNIWRYIQMVVIPNIIHERWGWNPQRFYEKGNRIYIKILWWYVHLSWNNSEFETLNILLDEVNSTDTIAQLVERIGENGYRIEVYRDIMRKKSKYKLNANEFRKLMVLNSARTKVINPYLLSDGEAEYVDNLIKDVRGN